MKNIVFVCGTEFHASLVFDSSRKTTDLMFNERSSSSFLYKKIRTPDTTLLFISKFTSGESVMGMEIHQVHFLCDEMQVIKENKCLYFNLYKRRIRYGFPFEFTHASVLYSSFS